MMVTPPKLFIVFGDLGDIAVIIPPPRVQSGSISASSWENKIIGNSPFKSVMIVVIVKSHERQNKCRYLLNVKYCVCVQRLLESSPLYHGAPVFQKLWQTLMSHVASLLYMFINYHKHSHCALL